MRLGFITSNKGKLLELQTRLSPLGHEVVQILITYPELQAENIDDVARYGLEWIISKTNASEEVELDALKQVDLLFLEDSGLFVHGLNNFPGVYSKFVFQTIGYNGILRLLQDNTDREAHFESCIAVTGEKIENNIQILKGICNGIIVDETRGNNGFGFDPIFQPQGMSKTFAEMETEEKNKYSHRGMAMEKFVQFLKSV
jgi:XTP/dITP diphosphohydrolase